MREFIKSVGTVLPEIPKPEKKPTLNERFVWTAIALIAYLVMATTPLYGFTGVGQNDQLAFLRVVFASTQGTLMELGIGPIVTSGLILQLLVGSDIIKLDMSDSADRAIFGSATKFLTLIVIVGESLAYILGGALGTLTSNQELVIFVQLFIASLLVLLLDELIQKGWGIGSGVSLFILAGVCQTVMWYTFSPITFALTSTTTAYFGFIPATISAFFSNSLPSILVRDFKYPSLLTFTLTIVMLLVLVYIEGIRVELPITSIKYRGFQGVYPIKLLYVSNIPVILVSALGANVTFFTRILSNYVGSNPPWWMHYLAVFPPPSTNSTTTSSFPIGGVVYYMTAPQSVSQTVGDPIHSVVYLLYLVGMAVLFARLWVEIGGLNPRAVAKNLMDADVQVPGFRRTGLSIEQMLNRYIPTLTIIGGILIGLVAGVSDLFGVFGTGIGILLMVDIILQYYQMLLKEQVEEVSPALAGLIGAG
ncbi:MAG TPA: preprotein translocase subunit SecY [Nitrososphaerales archaeon]|nr:preprotein translocase subunit SecY [Nitrososphaerales archaeon]